MKNEYGFIDDGKVYLKGFLNYPDREIGTVLLTDEKAIEYFENRYSMFVEKVNKLENAIGEAENKGSYLMKIIHLQESLGTYNGLGDFEGVNTRLEGLKDVLSVDVGVNRERNLQLKQELLEKMKIVTARKAFDDDDNDEVQELHNTWLRIGRVAEGSEQVLESAFKEIADAYFTERREEKERQNAELNKRVERYRDLHSKAKELFYERRYNDNKKIFIGIQQEWKTVGVIPKDKFFRLNRDFRKLGNKYFERLNEEVKYMSQRTPDERSGLEIKEGIYERSKVVYDLSSDEAFQLVKLLQEEWKESGFVPKKMAPNMFNNFYKNCEFAYESKNFANLLDSEFGSIDEVPVERKLELILQSIEEVTKDIETAESQMYLYNDRRDDDSKRFASRLMVMKRKLEAKEIIYNNLNQG